MPTIRTRRPRPTRPTIRRRSLLRPRSRHRRNRPRRAELEYSVRREGGIFPPFFHVRKADGGRGRSAAPSPICLRGVSEASRRSEEHTSELQSLMRISYAVFCLKKKKNNKKDDIKDTRTHT